LEADLTDEEKVAAIVFLKPVQRPLPAAIEPATPIAVGW
jgi:hypothetical protein